MSHDVQPDARATAVDKPPLQGVGSTRPVVIDLAQGQVHTFTGTRLLGMALQGTIRTQQQFLYPHPAELMAHRPPPP